MHKESDSGQEGYKKVKIGPKEIEIPEEWRLKDFEYISRNEKNSIIDGPFGTQLKVNDFVDKGIPVIEMKHLDSGDIIVETIDRYISKSKFKNLRRSAIRSGDIIISKTGTLGLTGIVTDTIPLGIITSRLAKISPDESKVSIIFLKYWLDYLKNKQYWETKGIGTTMLILNLDTLKTTPIPLPSKKEQRKIGEILSTVDQAINQTDKIIEKTQLIKKGLMRNLLIKGINKNNFRNIKIGFLEENIPIDWHLVNLDEIVSNEKPIVYGIVQAGPNISNGIPYIRSTDLTTDFIKINNLLRTSDTIHKKYKRAEVKPGDIVFSLRGNIGDVSIVPDTIEYANLTQGTARISCKDNICNRYVFYALQSSFTSKRIFSVSKGSTFKEITLEELRKIPILLPKYDEQKKIAEILSTIDLKLFKEKQYKLELESVKKGLMQDLLTGKKRIKVENT